MIIFNMITPTQYNMLSRSSLLFSIHSAPHNLYFCLKQITIRIHLTLL